jgi:hypothetical protein
MIFTVNLRARAPLAVYVIFGVVFFLAGCVPGVVAGKAVVFAIATRGWSETSATIVSVDLHRGAKRSAQVVANYRYRGPDPSALEAGAVRDYVSNQIGIHGGSDNLDSWQLRTFARLDQARRGEHMVPCWYDPANPAQVVLDRDPRWLMIGFLLIFPLLFGLLGGGIAVAAVGEWRKRTEPTTDPRSLAGITTIVADEDHLPLLWFFTVIANFIAWIVCMTLQYRSDLPWTIRLGSAILPAMGLCLLFLMVRKTIQAMHHGRPRLRLDEAACLTGRRVLATVLMATGPGADARIEARLVVVRRIVNPGRQANASQNQLWSCPVPVDPSLARRSGTVWEQLIELPLPSDLPSGEDTVSWRLEFRMIGSGPDLSATFTLPVAAGDDGAVLLAAEQRDAADRAAPLAVLRAAGFRLTEDRDALLITIPAWRNPWLYGPGCVGTLLLTYAALLSVERGSWWTLLVSLPLFALGSGSVLRSALWRSTISLSPRSIIIEAGWWRRQRHELPPVAMSGIDYVPAMNLGEVVKCNVWLRTTDGTRIALARGLPEAATGRLIELFNTVRGP